MAVASAYEGGGQGNGHPESRDGYQCTGVLGEVHPLLGGRAALRAGGARPLSSDLRRGRQVLRREHYWCDYYSGEHL